MKTYAMLLFAVLLASCQHSSSSTGAATASFANKTDFICGMEVKPEFTDTCQYDGKTYAFCSASCKEEFLKDPAQYLEQK